MKIEMKILDRQQSHDLIGHSIAPLPIVFISTIGPDGAYNAAPFSFATPVCSKPPIICVSIGLRLGQKKDTLINIEFTKDFVINIVNEELAEAMNQSSAEYPSDVDEFKEVGLTPVKADVVKSPMVAESPVNMECQLVQILEFGELPRITSIAIGEVVRVHIKDGLLVNGEIPTSALMALGRLGGNLYCRTTDLIEMDRPFTV